MYKKEDFLKIIEQESLKYPKVAALYKAGDPRIFQVQYAMAAQMEMLSQQIEVAMAEPFLKSRDATVLADAALKGLIFSAKPVTVQIKVINPTTREIKIQSGRELLDSSGRIYHVDETVTIPSAKTRLSGEGFIIATQYQTTIQTHKAEKTIPFYGVEVEQPKDGSTIMGLKVRVNGQDFEPRHKFDIDVNEPIYHVESDEFKRLWIKFGESEVVGVGIEENDVITIEKYHCFGNILPEFESPFSFTQLLDASESELSMSMQLQIKEGTNATDIATLRELVKYPSIYNPNAVFLGEFDMLLRKTYQDLLFINVWNEQREEQIRGANVNNVNTLFYSFVPPEKNVQNIGAIKRQIELTLHQADNSYKCKYIPPVIEKINITVNAVISKSYDAAVIIKEIQHLLINKYGKETINVHNFNVKHREIYSLLVNGIPALNDARGDLNITVASPKNMAPETFRYADLSSIKCNITNEGYTNSMWGGT